MNPHRWLREHSLKLLAIRDTPVAIAGGVAIGIFFGFTPLFGLKTLLAIFFAWLTGSNILAAVLASALHDIVLPLMPLVYSFEYGIGYFLLSHPHHWPNLLTKPPWEGLHGDGWLNIFKIGKDLLLGSIVVAGPFALLVFFITKPMVVRYHQKHHSPPPSNLAD
jgi:uncharacterized protein (DUF2062 family)